MFISIKLPLIPGNLSIAPASTMVRLILQRARATNTDPGTARNTRERAGIGRDRADITRDKARIARDRAGLVKDIAGIARDK